MEWFSGNVTSAVQKAKHDGTIFLVFVYGDDDDSKSTLLEWNNECIKEVSDNCVAIKLESSSQSCQQFSQIYPVMCVPSIFFISARTGLPLEVHGGKMSHTDIVEKYQLAKSRHVSRGTAAANTSGAAANSSGAAASSQPPDQDKTAVDNRSDKPADEDSISLEEKKRRAEALLAAKREQKTLEEIEKEKASEIERRRLGQDLAKLRQFKEEQERKELEQARRKEKEEARLARERVKQQIEQDRLDRAARYQKEKTEADAVKQKQAEAKIAADEAAVRQRTAVQRETTRIQFRLPDGSSVTESFKSSQEFRVARDRKSVV